LLPAHFRHMMKVLVMVLVMLTSHGVNGFTKGIGQVTATDIAISKAEMEKIETYDFWCNIKCASAAAVLSGSCALCFGTPEPSSCLVCAGSVAGTLDTCSECPATLCAVAALPAAGACLLPKDIFPDVYKLCEFCFP